MNKIKIIFSNIFLVFNDKSLYHYAASLSFYSVLALIPFLFITLSVFVNMPSFAQYAASFEDFITSSLLPANTEQFSNYLHSFLDNSSKLGVVGIVAMFFTTIMFFADFEFVVTRIVHTEPRGFFIRLSIFWTLLTLMPLGLALSFWMTGYFNDFLEGAGIKVNFLEIFPHLVIWVIFSITYGVCINRKLKAWHVMFCAFVSSLAWTISKLVFVQYVFYNKSYTSIYGSLSILLFFFLWLYVSWIVFLFGIKLLGVLSKDEQGQNLAQNNEQNLAQKQGGEQN